MDIQFGEIGKCRPRFLIVFIRFEKTDLDILWKLKEKQLKIISLLEKLRILFTFVDFFDENEDFLLSGTTAEDFVDPHDPQIAGMRTLYRNEHFIKSAKKKKEMSKLFFLLKLWMA